MKNIYNQKKEKLFVVFQLKFKCLKFLIYKSTNEKKILCKYDILAHLYKANRFNENCNPIQ